MQLEDLVLRRCERTLADQTEVRSVLFVLTAPGIAGGLSSFIGSLKETREMYGSCVEQARNRA